MKLEWTDKKLSKVVCAHCDNKDELHQELSGSVKCITCKKEHLLEVYICKCGEHYYQFQTQHLLRQRQGIKV